ncbi:hypothetical protein [Rhodovulum sulfidophilum]|uniref:hypothetical protein n=1 Tax=Rhodovulum sulfidophilum TaxID=35806 RepID=UPI00117B4B41|nr:hypothetical protein [Rhodovulum sulfidophilum]MBL3553349.1 hypothetical protein [Rhodovulum sulfidophilum]
MKKILIIFASVAALAAMLSLGDPENLPWPASSDAWIEKDVPPENFDPAAYPELTSASVCQRDDVLDLRRFGQLSEYSVIRDLGVSYFYFHTEDEINKLVFLDRTGEVIGVIDYRGRLVHIGHFFLANDGYYQIRDGDISTHRPYQDAEVSSVQALRHMINESDANTTFYRQDVPGNSRDEGIDNVLHVMFHQGVWKSVKTSYKDYFEMSGFSFERLDTQYGVARSSNSDAQSKIFGNLLHLELTFFHRKDYVRGRGPVIGSPTGSSIPAHWRGTGYYTVFMGDQPALRFRIENDIEQAFSETARDLMTSGGKDLDFIVIEHHSYRGKYAILFRPLFH